MPWPVKISFGFWYAFWVALTNEVLQKDILDVTAASVALDHVHLVRVPGVDVAVGDIADIDIGSKGAHGTATTPVAVDVLNQNVLGGTL